MRAMRFCLVVVLAATATACTARRDADRPRARGELVGLFSIRAGGCADPPRGSWFRVVNAGGSLTSGPFVDNRDSPCADHTFTPLRPGRDGGLRTGAFQPFTSSPFDFAGDARDDAIIEPVTWFSVRFSLATNEREPQAKIDVVPPTLIANGRALSGDLRALSVAWSGQFLHVGAPKPDGTSPGDTTGPRGAFDATTGSYSLDWSSLLIGGPFNNSTAVWHLEGTFSKAATA